MFPMVSNSLDRNFLYDASSGYVDMLSSNSELFCNLHTSSYDAFPFYKKHIFLDHLCDWIVESIEFLRLPGIEFSLRKFEF